MSVVEKIQHCQRNIKKCCDNEEKMLHYIQRLYTLPVTVQHLQDTGVGRTVNALRKYEGGVGDAAKALVAKWKAMVANEDTSDGEDEDEACVPDAPESYDSPESPKLKEKQKADSTVKISRHKSDSSKHKHQQKSEKNDVSEHNSKHSSKSETKVKSSENESNITKESSKSLKNESQKEKHDKSHSSKHESKQEKRFNSNDVKSSSSTHLKKSTDKLSHNSKLDSTIDDNEECNKKRKLDSSNSGKKKSKRRRHSENESDEDRTISYNAEKQNTGEFETELNKKTDVLSKQDVLNKIESKNEKSKSREKGKQSSSKEEKIHDDKNKKKSDENREKQKTKDNHHSSKSSTSKSHHSSNNKDHAKDKDKTKRKENEERKHKHQNKNSSDAKETKSGSKESKEKVKIKQEIKQEINGDEGIDCNSGASFAEALGMCTVAPSSRKRHNNSPNLNNAKVIKLETNISSTLNNKKQSSVKNEATSSDSLHPLPLLSPNVKLEPLSVNLASTLPEISPNYKPLPYINPVHRKEEDKVLTDVIHVKNQRTKVYSGNKTGYTSVPSLYEICIRVLIENIDALEFTGGVPYDIIKPVLERATPDQLFMLEHYNPYLIDDTDSLWQFHCNREFRNKQREEMETWREMYMRCLDEREAKLKTLTANIKQSIDKTVPLRSTKLAYVDNVVKPPRNVLKKQAKYGTANSVPTSTSDLKKKLIIGGGPTAATNISVPPPPMNRVKPSSAMTKKTKAPLMAKALQLIKGRYKR
ncbi:transcription elongation factor B polypeptide 3 [Vespa crabro]|uniref:transcription elongation factor B polypeptide 3 n=1 Tax=Vespa crabro TaxID=7445 RepID=UPI001F00C736|nr:transcription elongation factor B polypeptide 3 [Vespa crabro]XP_046828088.1 transcription elongation factor B polypeptide 3 [Vespa crabro]XP_046828089.1 transcription elongation factor B polypeptide 3 [Vespa crabro]XP_046828091.1 transcription elongation factor B polypeptide 3 [Vespa crabro]